MLIITNIIQALVILFFLYKEIKKKIIDRKKLKNSTPKAGFD